MRKGIFAAFVAALSIFIAIPSYADTASFNTKTEESYGAYTSKEGEPLAYRDSKGRFDFYSDGVGIKLTLKENHDAYLSNWVFFKGKYYYFGDNGYLLTNTIAPGGFVVDATGAWTGEKSSSTTTYPRADYFRSYQDFTARAQALGDNIGYDENEYIIIPWVEEYAFSVDGANQYYDYVRGYYSPSIRFIDYYTLPKDHIALKVYDTFQPYNSCGFFDFFINTKRHEITIENPKNQDLWASTFPTLCKIREQFELDNPGWKVAFSNYGGGVF